MSSIAEFAVRLGLKIPSIELPAHAFFTPTNAFLDWMAKKKYGIVDIGAGVGRFQARMHDRHMSKSMLSIDYNSRDSMEWPVHQADALTFGYRSNQIITVCRPDHTGWIEPSIRAALKAKVKQMYYVGLDRNVKDDLCLFNYKMVFELAGEDGEHCWKIKDEK